jgi:hypothetical protein
VNLSIQITLVGWGKILVGIDLKSSSSPNSSISSTMIGGYSPELIQD